MPLVAAVAADAHATVAAAAPRDVEVRRLEPGADLRDVAFLVPSWEDADDLDFAALPALRVVQALSAGTDRFDELVPPWVTLCSARGARDAVVAEWVVGALLGATTGLLRAAGERTWSYVRPAELQGSTVVIVGFGSIGRAVAARLEPFGATVIGVARRARDGVRGLDELPDLLPQADAVVLLTPLTEATRGQVDAALLGRLRDGALLVNAGRGGTVDTDALLAELRTGRLRAVLDVVDPEPLPADHPLWTAPGLLALTAHVAGDSLAADERAALLAAEQLARFSRGEPLANVVRAATEPSPHDRP